MIGPMCAIAIVSLSGNDKALDGGRARSKPILVPFLKVETF